MAEYLFSLFLWDFILSGKLKISTRPSYSY